MGFGRWFAARGGLSFVGGLCGCEEADVFQVDVAAGGAFGADQVLARQDEETSCR